MEQPATADQQLSKKKQSTYDRGWRWKLAINGLGSVTTAIVTLDLCDHEVCGWRLDHCITLPTIVLGFYAVHRHYASLAHELSLDHFGQPPPFKRQRVIMPVSAIHQGTLQALDYALSSVAGRDSGPHLDRCGSNRKVTAKVELVGQRRALVVIESPYRTFLEPFLEYVNELSPSCYPTNG